MRLTLQLLKQHKTFQFRKHWLVQGNRKVIETHAHGRMKALGIPVVEANEFVTEKHEITDHGIRAVGYKDTPIPLDENHPDWKENKCHMLKNTNVLVEGLPQAQVLTKTVMLDNGLPKRIEAAAENDLPIKIHDQVRSAILSACVFDAEQLKLPKIKDPVRPAFNFPRILGITDVRRNLILGNKLLAILEKKAGESTKDKTIVHDADYITTFEKEGDVIQFQQTSNILISSKTPLKPILEDVSQLENVELPNMYPIKHTLSIGTERFYKIADEYPIRKNMAAFHPHTAIVNFNKTKVQNLFDIDVTDQQKAGRTLLHAFTVAASYAKTLHGNEVSSLPKPVTVQCIQLDSGLLHFGIFQLNTLNVDGQEGVKNLWYASEPIVLYESCGYVKGRPELTGYNPRAINYLNAFYNNQ